MIYDFTIKETRKTTVSVRADTPDEAQKTFTEWYNRHCDNPTDTTIDDLLDDGYDGREIIRSVGKSEKNHPIGSVMLPEEKSTPVEPKYTLQIRFADGSETLSLSNRTLAQIGIELTSWSDKYYLFPDTDDGLLMCKSNECESKDSMFCLYAVLKDQEENWFEIE